MPDWDHNMTQFTVFLKLYCGYFNRGQSKLFLFMCKVKDLKKYD